MTFHILISPHSLSFPLARFIIISIIYYANLFRTHQTPLATPHAGMREKIFFFNFPQLVNLAFFFMRWLKHITAVYQTLLSNECHKKSPQVSHFASFLWSLNTMTKSNQTFNMPISGNARARGIYWRWWKLLRKAFSGNSNFDDDFLLYLNPHTPTLSCDFT